jgi:hypothetical protein
MNQHTYTEFVPSSTKTIVETLPEGRYLEPSEVLQGGDLVLNKGEKSRTTGRPGKSCADAGGHKYYRPEPIKKEEPAVKEEPGYYYLKAGEEIKEGDEWNWPHAGGWQPYGKPTKNEALYACNVGRCRRKIVKPEPKFKVGDKVKILHEGRKGQIGEVISVLEKENPMSWRNFVYVDGVGSPKYADHELELVEDVSKPKRTAYKYRELAPTEVIQKGDQYYNAPTRAWKNVKASVGYYVSSWPTICTGPVPGRRFRRKV